MPPEAVGAIMLFTFLVTWAFIGAITMRRRASEPVCVEGRKS